MLSGVVLFATFFGFIVALLTVDLVGLGLRYPNAGGLGKSFLPEPGANLDSPASRGL
jgi:hypothetical protein